MKKILKKRKKKGFTLMELLVSLGIVAALSMMVAPMIMGKVDEAKVKADISNANAIAVAVKSEILEGTTIPASLTGDPLKTAIGEYFDNTIPVAQSEKNSPFVISNDNGKIIIKAGETQFYPTYILKQAPTPPATENP